MSLADLIRGKTSTQLPKATATPTFPMYRVDASSVATVATVAVASVEERDVRIVPLDDPRVAELRDLLLALLHDAPHEVEVEIERIWASGDVNGALDCYRLVYAEYCRLGELSLPEVCDSDSCDSCDASGRIAERWVPGDWSTSAPMLDELANLLRSAFPNDEKHVQAELDKACASVKGLRSALIAWRRALGRQR